MLTYHLKFQRNSKNSKGQSTGPGWLIRLTASLYFTVLVLFQAPTSWAQISYDTLLEQALQYRNAGEFISAEQTLRSARKLAAHTNEVDYLLGLVVAYQERYAEALAIINNGLDRYPDDVQLLLAKARVLSYTNNYLESLSATNAILTTYPGYTEAALLAARVNFYLEEYSRSRRLFNQVLTREPDNLEALLGLHDVELASDNRENARTLLDHAESVDPDSPDVVLRRERSLESLASSEERQEISIGYAVSNIRGADLSNWYDRSIEYRLYSQNGNQVFVRSEHLHRFGSHDTLLEVGGTINWGAGHPLELAIAYGDNSDFSPENRFRLATSIKIFDRIEGLGTSLLDLSYSQAEYQTGDVETGRMGVTHYFTGFNGWISTSALWVSDENDQDSIGWTSGINWQTTSRIRVGYSYTDAPEIENNITTDTETHHLYASYQLTDGVALRLDGSRNDRENSYSRDSLSLSLQLGF